MKTVFVSDLHLDAVRPQITRLFLSFLNDGAWAADRLFILGDLFEAWVGDDVVDATAEQVAVSLSALAHRGVEIGFICGNRDFLIGERFCQRCSMARLPDYQVIDLGGRDVLLCHGDTLCTDDTRYQAVRAELRTDEWQKAFLARSPEQRLAFAQEARAESQAHTANAPEMIMDVNAAAVEAVMSRFEVDTLIHGHTHRPAVHHLQRSSGAGTRLVLGDWYEQGSVAVHDQGELALHTL